MFQPLKHMVLICLSALAVYGFWVLINDTGLRLQMGTRQKKPFVSILLIARDEELRIEGIIRQLLGLEYYNSLGQPHFEVVAVSVDSQDDTAAILERMSRTETRLVVGYALEAAVYQEGLDLCQGEAVLLLDLARYRIGKASKVLELIPET